MKHSKNKNKTMWRIVKERTNKIARKEKQNTELKIDNHLTEDPKIVANTFNSFFLSIGQNYQLSSTPSSSSLPPVPPAAPPHISPILNSFFLKPVNEHEIYQIIKKKNAPTYSLHQSLGN